MTSVTNFGKVLSNVGGGMWYSKKGTRNNFVITIFDW